MHEKAAPPTEARVLHVAGTGGVLEPWPAAAASTFQVQLARGIAEALRLIHGADFDVVVVDIEAVAEGGSSVESLLECAGGASLLVRGEAHDTNLPAALEALG